jgi:hypothetical protein
MSKTRIPIETRTFDEPTRVVVEASLDTIIELDLDTLEGGQFDSFDAVISVNVTRETVTLTTVRTHAAWARGVPNAGRGSFVIPRKSLAALWI